MDTVRLPRDIDARPRSAPAAAGTALLRTTVLLLALAAMLLPEPAAAEAPPTPRYCKAKRSTFSSWKTIALNDGGAAVESPRTVWGMGPWTWDIDVEMDVPHTRSSDIEAWLVSPTGSALLLTNDMGGVYNDVFDPVTFDDQEAASIAAMPFSYDYNSLTMFHVNSQGALSRFTGTNPNGTWKLRVRDDAAGETGRLESWSMTVSTCGRAPETRRTRTISRTDVQAINDSPALGYDDKLIQTLDVPSMPGVLCDTDVTSRVTHPDPRQLSLLVMPPSRRISVLSDRRMLVDANSFNGTLWDDETTVPLTDFSVTLGYVPTTLVPEIPFSRGFGFPATGRWSFAAADVVPGLTGSMAGWTLTVKTCAWAKPTLRLNMKVGSKVLTACGRTQRSACRIRRSAAPQAKVAFAPAGAHAVAVAVQRQSSGRWTSWQASSVTTSAQGVAMLAVKRPLQLGPYRATARFTGDASSTPARAVTTWFNVVA